MNLVVCIAVFIEGMTWQASHAHWHGQREALAPVLNTVVSDSPLNNEDADPYTYLEEPSVFTVRDGYVYNAEW